ncbi:pantoate--beta-alanine ligase [Celerinatantimonas diazotrophica]|uniref:Pantothenate synthetase n=1 Tax=Celerinatantimonas diazotrophica TaxID=412034 RepID=A0A4R1J8L0_9GAMM|nr:pantoate--beta-alanine ligase [Celerinatantimonas diazotrophica]TCK46908.1 pantothenate synthetase [Celerinatantimonas diazotrophica]CAG9295675.1 Pantothenate synthetase [Celerinatantimonas diazotrophica]
MQTFSQIAPLKTLIRQYKADQLRVALVPTMGHLHPGHLHLIEYAKQIADKVVVSIFVNPLQFDRPEDLQNYPRSFKADQQKLAEAQTDILFAPDEHTMYPNGLDSPATVHVAGLSEALEGAQRPGHFLGVTTVVAKLFHIVQPDVACFGEKDFQQLAIIRRMCEELMFPIEIASVPIVRHTDGLAMSSRNSLLSKTQRAQAPLFAQTLRWAAQQLAAGLAPQQISQMSTQKLNELDFKTDAIDIVDADSLGPLSPESQRAVILAAAYLGEIRLIDNLVVKL